MPRQSGIASDLEPVGMGAHTGRLHYGMLVVLRRLLLARKSLGPVPCEPARGASDRVDSDPARAARSAPIKSVRVAFEAPLPVGSGRCTPGWRNK